MLIFDNMEVRNITPAFEDFLLTSSTGGMKAKRMSGTESGVVLERLDCLVMANGIEPWGRHELIDRVAEFQVDAAKYGALKFHEARALQELREARSLIWSGTAKFMQRHVLPRVKDGHVKRIASEFSRHSKERFNEYLALMCIVLDGVWAYRPMPKYPDSRSLTAAWLDQQSEASENQSAGTDETLYFLDTLADKYGMLLGAESRIKRLGDRVAIRATMRALLSDFRLLAKHLGMQCPWHTERQLGVRMQDSAGTLTKAGWKHRSSFVSGRKMNWYERAARQVAAGVRDVVSPKVQNVR